MIGGIAFLALTKLTKRGDGRLQQWVVNYLPVTIALIITTGVPPPLFVQVLYGRFFFSAAILILWAWLAVIVALLLSYYGIHTYAVLFVILLLIGLGIVVLMVRELQKAFVKAQM